MTAPSQRVADSDHATACHDIYDEPPAAAVHVETSRTSSCHDDYEELEEHLCAQTSAIG